MKYFKVFNTEGEYIEYIASGITPNVSTLRDSSKTWINPVTRDYSKEYFTIESLEDNNTIKMVRNLGGNNFGEYIVEYSTDEGSSWSQITLVANSAHTYDITTLNSGEKVMFRYVSGQFDRDNGSFTYFDSDGRFNVYGNITSLRATDFSGYTGVSDLYIYLFKGSKVVSAKDLVLPFQTVSTSGFSAMFSDCTYLTDAPELPATTIAAHCYKDMFSGCTALTNAPSTLPATTVPNEAYRSMFYGCSNLVNVQSILPATTVGGSAYTSMFNSCTSLRTAPELSATTLGASCYAYMFQNCSSLVTAPSELPATTLANACYREMFGDCTSLTSVSSNYLPAMSVPENAYRSMFCRTSLVVAPNLPATTLGVSAYTFMFGECALLETAPTVLPALTASNNAYQNMFINCSALTSAPEICATTVNNSACLNMFSNCTSLTTAPTIHAATALGGSFKGAFSGCTSLVTAPSVLSATTLGNECYKEMFIGCKKITTAPTLPATTLAGSCYYSMFYGCTSLTATPSSLPATTLANNCYQSMFQGCTGLTTAPTSLPAATLPDSCYYDMFRDCTSLSAAPEICATTVGTSSCKNMFYGCTGITTAQAVLPALTLANSSYYSMYERTNITTAPVICATTVDVDSCHSMFYLCKSLTTVQSVLPATTLADKCYYTMFLGCTNLTTAPELPATTLASECYRTMFSGCNKLNYIKCLATDISASNCTSAWVQNVASSGTFVKSSEITEQTWGRGGSGIPTDWVVYDDTHVSVTGVTINTATATVDKGDTYTLTATVLPVNASVQTVTWSTSDSSVATVVDGVVTGVGCGNATITVTTTEGSYTAQCSVTVENHVTSVDLNTYVVTIHSGHTYQLVETVYPSDACDTSVTWLTSDSSIASVDTNGLVSGVTTGSATVTVTTTDGGFSKNCSVTVDEGEHASAVTLSDESITLNKNNTYTLTATVLPADAYNKNVTWSSSDSTIATVDASGVVSGVSCGNANIIVTTVDGGHTAQCQTTIVNPVSGVTLNTDSIEIMTGGTTQLVASVEPSDACGDTSVTWTSSDSNIATVSNNGLVSGISGGNATITVTTTVGSYTDTCSVLVKQPVTSVTLDESTLDIVIGQTTQLTATVLPDNAYDKSVTWASSDSSIITVDSNGVVSGVASGSATITVTTTDGGYTAQCSVGVSEPTYTSMAIEGASVVSAETCTYRAICNNVEDVTSSATWSITAGSQYATINPNNGVVTILNGANESSVGIQAVYAGLTAATTVTLTYLAGATSETTSVITTDIGGNVTSVVTTITTYADSSSTEVVETIVTDVNGDLVGSTESTTTNNADGSYNGVTTNYDENGDPTDGVNVTGDTEGNVSTQTVEYDDSGNTTVTGYDIDTSGSESGKEFMSGGTNTEYYAFDLTHGFKLDIDFTIDFSNQPPGQSDGHHNILTAKRATPEPWYGFQIRHSNTNKYIQLGTQFTTGGNTNTTINPSSTTGNVGSYSLRIVYDPNSSGNKFVCTNMVTGNEIYSSTGTFPDLEELKYLRITIGNATDGNGNPFRYSNITVSKFELKKLKYVANPTMTYEYGAITINCSTVGSSIYYRLNLSGSYSAYTTPITITADTVVQAYATYSGDTSDIVREDFEIVDVTGVTLSDNSIAIGQGRTYTLTATVLPSDALDKSVIWSSSDSNVASVDSSGVVSGVASGSATITVTTHDGGYTAQCAVSVSASPYTELEYIASTSTGGQYIDLDIMLYDELNKWYDIAIKFNAIGAGKGGGTQPTIFGCQDNTGSPWPGTFIRKDASKNNMVGRYIGGSGKDNTLGQLWNDIELTPKDAPNMNVYNLNNSNKTHTWGTSLFCIFNNQAKTTFDRFIEAKLYYFKLYSKASKTSQGVLVRDMMPCKRNSDNAIGLLDKVNNVFYTNPSGDAFVAGPVVNS